MSLAARALAKAIEAGPSEDKEAEGPSPMRMAITEAYEALEAKDPEAFAEAFEAAVGIRVTEGTGDD